tara:strand:- start:682 stop:1536 length:855 start_codon:yes stop_codon:yes gene_type:complete
MILNSKNTLKTVGIIMITASLSTAALASEGCEKSGGKSNTCNTNINDAWYTGEGAGAQVTDTAYNEANQSDEEETATTSFVNNPYLYVASGDNTGAKVLDIETLDNGDLKNPHILRTFTVGSNADHAITISFDSIKVGDNCIPVFDAEGGEDIAGEADAVSGYMRLSVGDIELFKIDATSSLDTSTNATLENVTTLNCDFDEGEVGTATARIINPVASTTSIKYSLDVKAYGEDGSLIFDSNKTVNAGDAPAGAYDNDILIAVGLTNTYDLDTEDKYDGKSFTN